MGYRHEHYGSPPCSSFSRLFFFRSRRSVSAEVRRSSTYRCSRLFLLFQSPSLRELIVLRIRVFHSVGMADLSGIGQKRQFDIRQEFIQKDGPVIHVNRLATLGSELGLIEEHNGDSVERVDFAAIEIVLGRRDIAFENARALPSGQPHIRE